MWLWILFVVLVIIIIVLVSKSMSSSSSTSTSEATTTTTSDTALSAVPGTEDTSSGSVDAASASAATISYQDALVKYADARIQLNDQCQATPSVATYKNGTVIMLDNRAAVSRNIHLGTYFTIKGYGFKLVKLTAGSTLPETLLLDCGTSQAADQNVATITIQK